MTLLYFSLACSSPDPCASGGCGDSGDSAVASDSGDSGSGDSGSGGDTGEATLTGTRPEVAVAAPTFSVLNQDAQVRTRDDLLGHPTVMWFYPAAGTAG